MKRLVNGLSAAVRRAPWVVVGVIVVISLVLGALSGQFTPEEDSNESFAPDAPELEAVDRISNLFGEESSVAVMQVIVGAGDGNVIGLDGLAAVQALEQTVRGGPLGDLLVNEDPDAGGQPAILSFLAPVRQAIQQGSPVPATDQELREAYVEGLAEAPQEQAGFVRQLLPDGADPDAATASKGLMIILTTGAESTDEFDQFVDISAEAADEIEATTLPDGITAEAFSFELLFSDQDEFEGEVNRLFGMAFLIILTVLGAVFLILPRRKAVKIIVPVGFVLVVGVIAVAILPTLAKIAPGIFSDSIADWPENGLFIAAVATLATVFIVWAVSSKLLRRTVADTLITIVTIFFAIGWMNGIGFLLYEEANPMALILPILLIGLGVDYSIHLTSRYREEMAEDEATVDEAVVTAIKTVGIALVLATVTTAVGFLTNLTNDIPALREFGALAAVGIIASFVLMLTFVPAVRELLDRRGARNGTLEVDTLEGGGSRALPRVIGSTSRLAKQVPAGVLVATLGLAVFGGWGVTQLETKFSFIDFVPTTSPLRDTFQAIIDDFGGGFGENTQILIEGDVATGEAWNAMVDANNNLVGVDNVVTFAGNPAGTSPVAVVAQLGSQDSPTFDPGVGQALQAAGVDPPTFKVDAAADVGAVYDAAFAAAPEQAAAALHRDGSSYDAALFDVTTQAGEADANQLRTDVIAAFEPVSDAGLDAVPTSDEIINDVVVTTLRDSQLSSLLLTLVAALVLLVINFWFEARRPMLGVITTIPVALVVLLSFAIMGLIGIPFGPVTATIAALAIGIGIPYMIHITHRYLEDRGRFETASEAIESTLTHTGGALAGSAVTTVAGFGILVTSTTIPFRQFGFVTAYTILLAMLGAVLILPSMLVLWDRWHRGRGEEPFDPAHVQEALQRRSEGAPAS